eukprot:scaffold626_cov337-Pavlova_lutheri.AAC.53
MAPPSGPPIPWITPGASERLPAAGMGAQPITRSFKEGPLGTSTDSLIYFLDSKPCRSGTTFTRHRAERREGV